MVRRIRVFEAASDLRAAWNERFVAGVRSEFKITHQTLFNKKNNLVVKALTRRPPGKSAIKLLGVLFFN